MRGSTSGRSVATEAQRVRVLLDDAIAEEAIGIEQFDAAHQAVDDAAHRHAHGDLPEDRAFELLHQVEAQVQERL